MIRRTMSDTDIAIRDLLHLIGEAIGDDVETYEVRDRPPIEMHITHKGRTFLLGAVEVVEADHD